MKNKYFERIYNGIIKENPTFVIMLGMCPTLATTTSATNGFGMGIATTAVLIFSNLLIAALRNIIPDKVRIPAYIVVIASLVTIVELLMQAYVRPLYNTLGIYIPLIVVNCIIMGRAEAYAAKHPALLSACDGIGMGLGFTCALTIIGFCRELIGSGSVFGYQIIPDDFHVGIFIMAPGEFLVLACLTAIQNKLKAPSATNLTKEEKAKKKLAGEPAGCTGECGSCMLHAEEIVDKKIELKKADCQKLETARNEEGGNR